MSSTYIYICEGEPRSKAKSRLAHLKTASGWGYTLCLLSVLGLVFLALLALYPKPFYHGRANAVPGMPNPSTTSVTLATVASGASVTLIPGGGFKLSSTADTAAFDVITDNFTGYSVALSAGDNDRTLINVDNAANIISSITSPVDESNFVMTNPALVNRWGVKPNKYYNSASESTVINTSTILPAPDQVGIVLDVTAAANSTGNRYSVAIGAMVDGTKPAGTYERATTLTATANPIVYLVNYADNTGDPTVSNIPADASAGSVTATSITLASTVPTRDGYTFSGWCLGTVSDSGTTCTGTLYNAGGSFGIDQTIDNTAFTLYATWIINNYAITYGTVTGIDSVSLDGTACTTALSSGGCSKTLTYGQTYNLVATPSTGYSFTSWDAGDHGSIADTSSASTTYTVGAGISTITPTATVNTYAITYGTVTGIDSVSLDGTACTTALSSGGCSKTLTYGQTYNLVATPSTGYSFTSWDAGDHGSIADTSSASTTYTVGAGTSTITPTATINTYNVKVNFAGSGVSSVVFTATGQATRTVSTSGGTAELTYGVDYTMTMNFTSTDYKFSSWALNNSSYGSLSSTTINPSHFVPNTSSGGAVITATGEPVCSVAVGQAYNYSYTGAAQTFTAPCNGNYKVELWGAQGGSTSTGYNGGYGGYTSGTITASSETSLYVYVGGQGHCWSQLNSYDGGWNGGGKIGYPYTTNLDAWSCSGAGATDIRITGGAWDNASSLRSRIIVAGGGGGASHQNTTGNEWYSNGGSAGGLIGNIRTVYSTNAAEYYGNGGTQISGGTVNKNYANHEAAQNGGFGYGGYGASTDESSGGGSGWYGGAGTNVDGGGGGGSSYISGHTGSVAVASMSSSSPKSGCTTGTTNNACSITPYINSATSAGYTFTGTLMIDGLGYKWTNTKGALQLMPKPTGGSYASGTGHTGNGYARITYLGPNT